MRYLARKVIRRNVNPVPIETKMSQTLRSCGHRLYFLYNLNCNVSSIVHVITLRPTLFDVCSNGFSYHILSAFGTDRKYNEGLTFHLKYDVGHA
jgi:hypothetical protein